MPIPQMAAIIDGDLKTGLVIREVNNIGTNLLAFIPHATPAGRMQEMDPLTFLLHFDVFDLGRKLGSPA